MLLLSAIVSVILAQVVFQQDQLRSANIDELQDELRFNYPIYSLPPRIDNARLREEQDAAMEQEEVKSGFYQFGKAFPVELSQADGMWYTFENGVSVWRLALKSPTALSLNLLFSDFKLPEGAELYVRSANGQEVIGPFTHRNNKEDGGFATVPIAGHKLVLEYFVPEGYEKTAPFKVDSIVHGYRATALTHDQEYSTQRSGSCNVDVACKDSEGWSDQIRSVVMMMTRSNTGYCSGSMLNSAKGDGRQLFLTAHHCVGRDVSRDMVLFNYAAPSCGSRASVPQKDSAAGLTKLASNYGSDFAIFEVNEEIPASYNVYLSGWSAQPSPYVPEMLVGIHHPSADVKKISFANSKADETCWSGSCGSRSPDHWKVPQWHVGTTEPGSSGSPLFDSNKRVVGQLHGGTASCYRSDQWDVYGKLASSFNAESGSDVSLQQVLDPENTGVYYVDGVNLSDVRQELLFE